MENVQVLPKLCNTTYQKQGKNPSRNFCSLCQLQNREIVMRCHFKNAKKILRQCT